MAIHLSITRKKPILPLSSSTSASKIMIPAASSPAAAPTSTTVRTNNKPVSYHLLTVRLDVSRLRLFLLHTIPRYCPVDDDLIQVANDTYQSVQSKVLDHHQLNSNRKGSSSHSATLESAASPGSTYEACCHELNDCIAIISTFLSSCVEPLTPQTLSEAHYLVGSINEALMQPEQAKQSYMKALWIIAANSTPDIFPTEVLATTLHCLGRTYGLLGQHQEAIQLLYKAQEQYLLLNVRKDHAVVMEVQTLIALHGQRAADIATLECRNRRKLWSSSRSVSTLTLIVEDESESSKE